MTRKSKTETATKATPSKAKGKAVKTTIATPQAASPTGEDSFTARQNRPLPPIESTADGNLCFSFVGRATPEQRKARVLAFKQAMRDSGTGGIFIQAKGGHNWNADQWLSETGIPLPLSLEQAAAACERCQLSLAKDVLDAGYTFDAALTLLRNFLIRTRLDAAAALADRSRGASDAPQTRCPARKKGELAARILNIPESKGVRARRVQRKLEHCGLRDEGNGLWSILLDSRYLSAGEIDRLNARQWPPPH